MPFKMPTCFQIRGPQAEGLAKPWPNLAHHLFSHSLLIKHGFHIGVKKPLFNISRHVKITQISVSVNKVLWRQGRTNWVANSLGSLLQQLLNWTVPAKPKRFTLFIERVLWALPAPVHPFSPLLPFRIWILVSVTECIRKPANSFIL